MNRIVPISTAFATLAALGSLLPSPHRERTWIGVGCIYTSILVLGTVNLRSGIFARVVTRGRADRPQVALTFDDGPDPHTTRALLDLLHSCGVKATFFFVGARAKRHPDLVRRCVNEGHLVGNHSFRHSPFTNFLFRRALTRELQHTNTIIESITGTRPRYYRPPFGLLNHATAAAARATQLAIVGWSVRGLDTRTPDAARVVNRIARGMHPGAVILLHDGGRDPGRTLHIVRELLAIGASRGLEFLRLDRLIEDS